MSKINSTHGMSKTRIYRTWTSMRNRCKYKNIKRNHGYADRGIKVCDEWNNSFESFYNWAINNGYTDSLSIDRIDNNKGYCPNNCRWITMTEQQSNKRNNVNIMYNGKQYCLRRLCIELGFPYKTAHRRLQRMKAKNKPIDIDKLFEPIHTEKIAIRYRKKD